MDVRELAVAGAWEITPTVHADDRGRFLEWFKSAELAVRLGHDFHLRQANLSVSDAGVVRGIHFADVPPGQAKYVTCPVGAVLDVVVDIRVGSPMFGTWDAVLLDATSHRAVYVGEGLGHAFCALEPGSTVAYLCSEPYAPAREHGIHPLDPELGIAWPSTGTDGRRLELRLSPKDAAAPTLAEARAAGLLPTAAAVDDYLRELRSAAS